jgi:hypothetical protein
LDLVLGFQKKTSFRSFRVFKKRFTVCSDNCKRVKKPIYINVDYLARVRGRREGEAKQGGRRIRREEGGTQDQGGRREEVQRLEWWKLLISSPPT